MIARRAHNNQVAPVDAHHPPQQVHRCHQLYQPYQQLSLIDIRVAETGAKHGAGAWQEHIQAEADVRPEVFENWHIRNELPDAHILIAYSQYAFL